MMGFLFDRLRPKIDETALYDDEARDDDARDATPVRPARQPAVRWKVVLTCWIIILVGAAVILGAWYIGVPVDWALTDT
ncbi:hypothetical protein, partial [Microbacterium sp.]|uniref:hypothetical protein n=1 Tax=Microbacterium sp. TaxID=51671 RepID=UPI003F9A5B2D